MIVYSFVIEGGDRTWGSLPVFPLSSASATRTAGTDQVLKIPLVGDILYMSPP